MPFNNQEVKKVVRKWIILPLAVLGSCYCFIGWSINHSYEQKATKSFWAQENSWDQLLREAGKARQDWFNKKSAKRSWTKTWKEDLNQDGQPEKIVVSFDFAVSGTGHQVKIVHPKFGNVFNQDLGEFSGFLLVDLESRFQGKEIVFWQPIIGTYSPKEKAELDKFWKLKQNDPKRVQGIPLDLAINPRSNSFQEGHLTPHQYRVSVWVWQQKETWAGTKKQNIYSFWPDYSYETKRKYEPTSSHQIILKEFLSAWQKKQEQIKSLKAKTRNIREAVEFYCYTSNQSFGWEGWEGGFNPLMPSKFANEKKSKDWASISLESIDWDGQPLGDDIYFLLQKKGESWKVIFWNSERWMSKVQLAKLKIPLSILKELGWSTI